MRNLAIVFLMVTGLGVLKVGGEIPVDFHEWNITCSLFS